MNPPVSVSLVDDPELTRVNMEFYRTSFVSSNRDSKPGEERLRIQYYFRKRDGHLFTEIDSGPLAEGPPGLMHGGAMAAILDEAMGVMVWFHQLPVVTANLNLNFRRPLPLGQRAILETWIERRDGKKIHVYGEIRSAHGVHAEGTGLFIQVPFENFRGDVEKVKRHYGF